MTKLNVVAGTPNASNGGQAGLTREQVAKLADLIAHDLYSIRRLAYMAIEGGDIEDMGAIGSSIVSLANGAGYMADLISAKHGGMQFLGDANDWLMPPSLDDLKG